MKKKIFIIITMIVLITLLIGLTKLYNYLAKSEIAEKTINYSNEIIDNNISLESKIFEITEDTFNDEVLKEKGIVLVDFYATWCGPCKIMKPIIEELSKEYTSIKFVEIDIDNSPKLADEYNIIYIPTFIVFENGQIKNQSVGAISKEEIINLFN